MDYDIFNDTSSAAPHTTDALSKGQAPNDSPQSNAAEKDNNDPS